MKTILFCLLAMTASAFADSITHPYLFEIRSGQAVSYIFGTQHTGINLSEVADAVKPKILAARAVYLEVISTAERQKLWEEDPVTAALTVNAFPRPSPPLPEALKERLKTAFDLPDKLIQGLRMDSCDSLGSYIDRKFGGIPLDHQITNFARANNIELRALEDDEVRSKSNQAAESSGAASTCSVEAYANLTGADYAQFIQTVSDQYRTGVPELGKDQRAGSEVANRNAYWVTHIESELRRGGLFLAFGVGHLWGEQGMIEKLKALGFEVRRL